MWVNVTFYGVRGSCPCSGDRYRRYGGNTSCLVIDIEGDEPLIVDLGTGLRCLRRRPAAGGAGPGGRRCTPRPCWTHLHFDHILGIPFFSPLHDPGARLTVYGPAQPKGSLKDALHAALQPPVFPIHMEQFRGELITVDVGAEDFSVGQAEAMAWPVLHSGGDAGLPDRGRGPLRRGTCPRLPGPARPPGHPRGRCSGGARTWTCLIHDGQYTDDEFSSKADWGHATAAYAVHVAAQTGVKRLLLSHHDPSHTDRELDKILNQASRLPEAKGIEDVSSAHESQSIDLGKA